MIFRNCGEGVVAVDVETIVNAYKYYILRLSQIDDVIVAIARVVFVGTNGWESRGHCDGMAVSVPDPTGCVRPLRTRRDRSASGGAH